MFPSKTPTSKSIPGPHAAVINDQTSLATRAVNFVTAFSCLVPMLAFFALAVNCSGQVTFIKVADTTQVFPGQTTTNFTSFGPPAINAGVVAFEADGAPLTSGVFRWTNGVLQKAADYNTSIPFGTGKFTFFSGGFATYTENGLLTFRGIGSAGSGLYQYDGVSLTRLFDTTTPNPIPGGTGPFATFLAPNMKNGMIAFLAVNTNNQRGIFLLTNSTLSQVLAPATPYPGGGTGVVSFSSQVGFDKGNLAFWAFNSATNTNHAIFTLTGGMLTKVAEKNVTIVPGLGNPFTSLSSPPDVSGSKVAFAGNYSGGSGIYSANLDGSGLGVLVDVSTPIPSGVGNFASFGSFEYDQGDLVFYGIGATGAGIYRVRSGVVTRVIDTSLTLDGKGIANFNFRDAGYANGEIAFRANFNDGSRGIYTVNLGAPAGAPDGGSLSSFAYSPITGARFMFSGATPGTAYRIQFSSALISDSWNGLTNFTYNGPVTVNDGSTAGVTKRFYRAVTP